MKSINLDDPKFNEFSKILNSFTKPDVQKLENMIHETPAHCHKTENIKKMEYCKLAHY